MEGVHFSVVSEFVGFTLDGEEYFGLNRGSLSSFLERELSIIISQKNVFNYNFCDNINEALYNLKNYYYRILKFSFIFAFYWLNFKAGILSHDHLKVGTSILTRTA